MAKLKWRPVDEQPGRRIAKTEHRVTYCADSCHSRIGKVWDLCAWWDDWSVFLGQYVTLKEAKDAADYIEGRRADAP